MHMNFLSLNYFELCYKEFYLIKKYITKHNLMFSCYVTFWNGHIYFTFLGEFERTLTSLIKVSTALELKWIIRIILKDLKLGMGNNRLLKVFHEDAPDFYDVCSNLEKVYLYLQYYIDIFDIKIVMIRALQGSTKSVYSPPDLYCIEPLKWHTFQYFFELFSFVKILFF